MDRQRLRIFISSPGDVTLARERAAQVIDKLAHEYARYFIIDAYRWEYEPMLASGHFQDSIEPPADFDVVILILGSRLGTPLPERTTVREYRGMDGRAPVTGTEWEFENALEASRKQGGVPDLLVYRSESDATISARDPQSRRAVLDQLEALDAFWRRHFVDRGEFIAGYADFQSLEEFSAKFEEHLRRRIDKRIAALQPAARAATLPLWVQAPFRGLEAYEFEHEPVFYGREEAIGSALLRLITNATKATNAQSFLLVLGASGSGKSSLVKAGVVPRLMRPQRVSGMAFPRRVLFRAADAREGEDLFDALARCLTQDDEESAGLPELLTGSVTVTALAQHLRAASAHPDLPFATALERVAEAARATGHMLRYEQAKLILIVDQLEELFASAHVQPDERKRFVELLQGLAQSGLVWVIATMRADFWHRAGETPELVKLADGNGRLDLLPPTPAELSQMIRGPADAALIHFEVSGATHIPLNDLIAQEAAGEPGALPLLSFVLAQLYQRDVQDRGGDTLTYASYEALGGLRGAIATRAEAVMAAQPQDVRSALRQVLFSLVQMSEGEGSVEHAVARRAPLSNFPPGTAKRKLIDAFLDPSARLLVADAAAGPSATVRLAHEALLSHWEAARRYVAENLEALKSRRFIEEQYKHWQEHRSQSPAKQAGANGRPRSVLAGLRALFAPEQGLLSGLELTGAERLSRDYSDELAPELVDYIQRSLDQDRQRDRRTERIAYAVAGVFLVLSVLSGIAWWIASDQRDLARSEAATTDRTTTFMESLFESANPETNRGVDITVSKWLDNGATDLEQSSQQAPRVRAELLTAIGQAYSGLGSYAKAEDLLLRARQAQEAPNALIPNESRARTMVASGMAGYLAGHYDQAVGFQRAAVDLTRHEPLKSTVLRSEALTGLADALVAQGIHEEAIKLCLEALAADRKRRPEDAAVLANTLSSLAGAYFFEDNLKAAEAPLREALSLREHVFGLNHALTGESMLDLAALLHQLGHDNEAIEEFQKALPIYRQVYGDKHPDLATLLNDLGRSELMVGRIDDAEQHLRQSLAMSRQFESEDHDNLVAPLNSLGMIDTYRGRTDAAASELAEAESIAGKRAHSDLLDQVLLDKADLEIVTGHPALAEASLTKSKQLLQATYRNDTNNAWRYAVWDMIHVHLLAASNNNTAEAQQTLVAAESVVRQRFGANGFYSQLAERIAQSIKQTAIRAMWDKEMLASDEECGAAFWTDPSRWHVEFVV